MSGTCTELCDQRQHGWSCLGGRGGGGGKIICKLTSSSCYAKKITVKFMLKFASSGLEKLRGLCCIINSTLYNSTVTSEKWPNYQLSTLIITTSLT